MFAIIEVQQHGAVATRGGYAIGRSFVLDLEISHQRSTLRVAHVILPIDQVGGSAIRVLDSGRARQHLNLPSALLTIIAITGDAGNRRAERLDHDISAGARDNRAIRF